MKGKRLKARKKTLLFYKNFFGYRPPYSVLIDGTFCKAALQFKINIMEQLPKYMDAEIRFLTTKCVLAECEALGTLLYGPLKVLRQFTVVNCLHQHPTAPIKCIRTVIKANQHTYCVATQDPDIQEKVRGMSGVPLIFIAWNTILLEPPASTSKETADQHLHDMVTPSFALDKIKKLKKDTFGEEEKSKRRKKKIKGVNPLSCKKKKKRTEAELNDLKKKRKQRKVKKKKVTLESLAKELT